MLTDESILRRERICERLEGVAVVASSTGTSRHPAPSDGWTVGTSARSIGVGALVKTVDEDCLGGVGDWVLGRLVEVGEGLLVGSFDELVAGEDGAGTDEGDKVRSVDGAPAGLGGLDQLKCHRQPRGLGAGAAGDLGAVPDGGEGRLDRVGGPQVDPVLGRKVVEATSSSRSSVIFRRSVSRRLAGVGQLAVCWMRRTSSTSATPRPSPGPGPSRASSCRRFAAGVGLLWPSGEPDFARLTSHDSA